jgi:hypothetical protein
LIVVLRELWFRHGAILLVLVLALGVRECRAAHGCTPVSGKGCFLRLGGDDVPVVRLLGVRPASAPGEKGSSLLLTINHAPPQQSEHAACSMCALPSHTPTCET